MKTSEQIIEAVAIAMRETYHIQFGNGELIPWKESDKKKAWLGIAEAGIEKYEEVTAPGQ